MVYFCIPFTFCDGLPKYPIFGHYLSSFCVNIDYILFMKQKNLNNYFSQATHRVVGQGLKHKFNFTWNDIPCSYDSKPWRWYFKFISKYICLWYMSETIRK